MAECKGCNKEFIQKPRNKLYCEPSCRWTNRISQKGQRAKAPDDRRKYWLNYRYGITPEQYQELLDKQGGCCAICSKTPDEEGYSLAVDHDHKSGEIRGILCTYCNRYVIGRHRDADLLYRMARYIENGKTGLFVPIQKKRPRKRKPKQV